MRLYIFELIAWASHLRNLLDLQNDSAKDEEHKSVYATKCLCVCVCVFIEAKRNLSLWCLSPLPTMIRVTKPMYTRTHTHS